MIKFSKFFILFLCCALLVVTIVRPVQVNASATVAIAIGVAGAIKTVVSSKALVAIIIAGFGGALGGAFFADIDSWYDEDPVIRDWAEDNAHLVQPGAIISVPSSVHSAIYDRYFMYTPVIFNTVRVPYSLTRLETVSALNVFGVDVLNSSDSSSILIENNALLNYANSTLAAISDTLIGSYSYYKSIIDSNIEWVGNVNDSLSTFGSSLKSWAGDINSNIVLYGDLQKQWLGNVNESIGQLYNSMPGLFQTLEEGVSDVNLSTVEWLGNVNSTVQTTSSGIKNEVLSLRGDLGSAASLLNNSLSSLGDDQVAWLGNVNSSLSAYGKDTVDWLKNVNSNVVSSTNALGTKIVDAINPSTTKLDTSVVDNAHSQELSIISGVSGSIGNTAVYYTDAGSVLNANVNNFLAAGLIFNTFANVPFVQQLLIVSVSIGIVGAILGIALSAAGRSGSDAKNKEKSKGGVASGKSN